MFHDDNDVEESSHQLTAIRIHRKKTIAHHEKISTLTFPERQYLYYPRHQRPTTSKNEIKKITMIDACQPLPLGRPFTAPVTRISGYRPKNFRVRVYRNGDDSICAYCASCTMDIILTDATRKLQMIRPAQRLFDCNGHEIFRSEDIQRDNEYYVSEGEDFINPLEAIKSKIQYRDHSKWTIDGIESSYIIKRQRRRRRQRFTSINNPKPPNYEVELFTQHENKDTQTAMKCENKDVQTDGKISLETKGSQTTTKCENKIIQTDGKIALQNKDTQTMTQYENKDIQTDGKTSLENKDTQTIMKLEHKDIQTDGKASLESKDTQTITKYEDREVQTDTWISPPPLRDNEVIRTTTNHESTTIQGGSDQTESVRTDSILVKNDGSEPNQRERDGMGSNPPRQDEREPNQRKLDGMDSNPPEKDEKKPDGTGSNPPEKDEREPNQSELDGIDSNLPKNGEREPNQSELDGIDSNLPKNGEREPDGTGSNPTEKDEREPNQKEPNAMGPNPSKKGEREPNRREPVEMVSNPPRIGEREPYGSGQNPPKKVEREPNQKKLDRPRSGQTTPVTSSLDVIYRRSSPTTNFRVKVYRNGEHNRYVYCKSCSMDIILSSATQKLQMPIPARRLFDADGIEIFHSKDIRRDSEYYVSSGGNFNKPLK